jgi:hypothetical protein
MVSKLVNGEDSKETDFLARDEGCLEIMTHLDYFNSL